MTLDHMRRELKAKAARVARETAREWERGLKADAPVESGELRDSIHVEAHSTAGGNQEIDAAVDVPYAFRMRPEWEEQLRQLPVVMARIWNRIP